MKSREWNACFWPRFFGNGVVAACRAVDSEGDGCPSTLIFGRSGTARQHRAAGALTRPFGSAGGVVGLVQLIVVRTTQHLQ